MLIQYIGDAGARHVGDYHWTRANGYVVDVTDPEQAAQLLTQHGFAVSAADPLAQLAGTTLAAELTLEGIAILHELARLDDAGIARLADNLKAVNVDQVARWVATAQRMEYEQSIWSAGEAGSTNL